ncbi:hypothetical protein [Hymenobacter psychrophilus]|uniref:Uncharacterized protein n=1 Tax=Hymenobacter psychrophilus TaxID=651662 RepID=A0A1H3MYD4_9BACT|nr:hypothetical protein [Hymenobacter psychrophilus]SDY81490.1 hypothetical protein SAMN04488069_11454 [Hymenobacter psychrophilus]
MPRPTDCTVAVSVRMPRHGKSHTEAKQIVDNWSATAKQPRAKYAG